jgi:hypothetical protein
MSKHDDDVLKMRDGLLRWVEDDAHLREDSTLTYTRARATWGLSTAARGLGRVLDDACALLTVSHGPIVARGVVAYVVNARTGQPGDGWDESSSLADKVTPEAARSEAREALRERRSELV